MPDLDLRITPRDTAYRHERPSALRGDASEPHVDLIPADIGLGRYDTAYKAHAQREPEQRKQAAKKKQ